MPLHGGSAPPQSFRLQGWDPILLLSQMLSFQTLHYLTLSLLTPALLTLLAQGPDLDREGGSANVAMLMDWREMTGISTVPPVVDMEWVSPLFSENARKRSWALAVAWIITAQIDVAYLYQLIRKPTHILDFSLTLVFIHTLLTTYYASSFPKSLFFWIVLTLSTVSQVIWAEQLCIRREMRQGVSTGWPLKEREEDRPAQQDTPPRRPRHKRANSLPSSGFAQTLGQGLKTVSHTLSQSTASRAPSQERYEMQVAGPSNSNSRRDYNSGRRSEEQEERQPLVHSQQQ